MADANAVVHVTDNTFDAEVIKAERPVLVDFWAPWCGPCKAVSPVVEEIAQDYGGRLKVAKVNVDDNPSTAANYGIRSIPTLMLFKDGSRQDTLVGMAPKERLEDFVKKVL